ncbi:MAG TPA: hypothetical protein VFQ61_22580, partial [Polyangiaceae bacterium]|nr:hypothetical protein [Polyangiaceae bacterium]
MNAFIPLSPVDGCSGGGKINLCSTESLVAIEEMSSRDPKIVEVVPAVDMPAKLSNDEFFARGASPGKTTIDFRGRFDDGSVRSATLDIEVASVTRLDIESRCTTEKNGVVLAAPGELASFEVLMYNQQRQLAGWHPSAIDS